MEMPTCKAKGEQGSREAHWEVWEGGGGNEGVEISPGVSKH